MPINGSYYKYFIKKIFKISNTIFSEIVHNLFLFAIVLLPNAPLVYQSFESFDDVDTISI